MKQDKVACKKIVGQTVCKVGSTIVMPKHPVPANIYTSVDCTWCPKEIDQFIKQTRKIRGIVDPVVRNVEENRDVGINELSVFPVVDFGNGIIEKGRISKLNERDIVGKVLEASRNGEMMRGFQGS